jgi:hypothetical protein
MRLILRPRCQKIIPGCGLANILVVTCWDPIICQHDGGSSDAETTIYMDHFVGAYAGGGIEEVFWIVLFLNGEEFWVVGAEECGFPVFFLPGCLFGV